MIRPREAGEMTKTKQVELLFVPVPDEVGDHGQVHHREAEEETRRRR